MNVYPIEEANPIEFIFNCTKGCDEYYVQTQYRAIDSITRHQVYECIKCGQQQMFCAGCKEMLARKPEIITRLRKEYTSCHDCGVFFCPGCLEKNVNCKWLKDKVALLCTSCSTNRHLDPTFTMD